MTPSAPISHSSVTTVNRNPITELERRFGEKGWIKVEHPYIKERYKIDIFNRSRGAESNYFVIARRKLTGQVEVLFTNPTKDVYDKEVVISKILTLNNISEVLNKIYEFAARKPNCEYWFNPHTHYGYIKNEPVNDDGLSWDHCILLQNIEWNYDFSTATLHNNIPNESLLRHLTEFHSAHGLTFIPGCELTIAPKIEKDEDLIFSPHFLLHFANIDTAMKFDREILAKRFEDKKAIAILAGPPIPFDEVFSVIERYRRAKKLTFSVAHPFSTLDGIDLFDPKSVNKFGYRKCWEIVFAANCSEAFNSFETHSELDFDLTDGKRDFRSDVADDLLARLKFFGAVALTPPALNYALGLYIRHMGKNILFGHDDHYVPGLTYDVTVYGRGRSVIKFSSDVFRKFERMGRKPRSDELIEMIIDGKANIDAFGYIEMTDKGPRIVAHRVVHPLKNFLQGLALKVSHAARIAHVYLNYWYNLLTGKSEMAGRIREDLKKIKAFQLKPN